MLNVCTYILYIVLNYVVISKSINCEDYLYSWTRNKYNNINPPSFHLVNLLIMKL